MHHSFWAHYCPCEKGVLWVARDEECNWCGLTCDPVLAEDASGACDAERPYSLAPKGDASRPTYGHGSVTRDSGA